MKRLTIRDFLEEDQVQACLGELPHYTQDDRLWRYDNPFERKWFLADKSNLSPAIAEAFSLLRNSETQRWVSKLLEVPILYCDFQHYGGLFIYDNGDYLKPHVDAGIHPKYTGANPNYTGGPLRKVATTLLYLTDAALETYTGDNCLGEDPLVWSRNYHLFRAGDLVLFTNTDTAWHGVPEVKGGQRVVLTVSYMAPEGFTHSNFRNVRTRAYFVRTTWEKSTPEIETLRQYRASEEHHSEVYRLGTDNSTEAVR